MTEDFLSGGLPLRRSTEIVEATSRGDIDAVVREADEKAQRWRAIAGELEDSLDDAVGDLETVMEAGGYFIDLKRYRAALTRYREAVAEEEGMRDD